MLQLIAEHDNARSSKNATLSDSVSLRRLDFVELLVDNVAEITSVPLAEALLTWEPYAFSIPNNASKYWYTDAREGGSNAVPFPIPHPC